MTYANRPYTSLGAAMVLLFLLLAACTPLDTANQPTLLPTVEPAQWQAGAVVDVASFDTDDCIRDCVQNGVASIALSPDGQTVAVGKKDNTLTLWNVADGTRVRELPRHAGWVTSVAFSPDGALVASASRDADDNQELHLWRVANGTLQRRIDLKTTAHITDIAFHPTDTQVIAVGTNRGGITFWRTDEDGHIIRRVIGGEMPSGLGGVQSLSFSVDGMLLAAQTYPGIQVWQTDTRTLRWMFRDEGSYRWYDRQPRWFQHIALSPDGTLLAGGFADSTTRIWRTANGEPLHTLNGYRGRVTSVDFSPAGHLLAVAYDSGVIDLWRVADGVPVQSLGGHETAVVRAVFSADGQTLVSASEDGRIMRWYPADPAAIAAIPTVQPRHTVPPTPLPTVTATPAPTFAPVPPTPVEAPPVEPLPADTLLIADQQEVLALSSDGHELARLALPEDSGYLETHVSPDGSWLAFSDSGTPYLVNLRTGERWQLAHPLVSTQRASFAFAPDRNALAFAIGNGVSWQVRRLDLHTLRSTVLWESSGQAIPVLDLAGWTADGILLRQQNGQHAWSVRLLDPEKGIVRYLLDGGPEIIPAPGGRWLALVERKWSQHRFASQIPHNTATLYDLNTGVQRPLAEWSGAPGNCATTRSPVWSPDGTRLAYWAGQRLHIIDRTGQSERVLALMTQEGPRDGRVEHALWVDNATLLMWMVFGVDQKQRLYEVATTATLITEVTTVSDMACLLHVPR